MEIVADDAAGKKNWTRYTTVRKANEYKNILLIIIFLTEIKLLRIQALGTKHHARPVSRRQ